MSTKSNTFTIKGEMINMKSNLMEMTKSEDHERPGRKRTDDCLLITSVVISCRKQNCKRECSESVGEPRPRHKIVEIPPFVVSRSESWNAFSASLTISADFGGGSAARIGAGNNCHGRWKLE